MATAATVPTEVTEKPKKARAQKPAGDNNPDPGSVDIAKHQAEPSELEKQIIAVRADFAKLAARAKRYQSLAEQLVQECEYFVKTHGSDYARRRSAEVKKELQEIAKL